MAEQLTTVRALVNEPGMASRAFILADADALLGSRCDRRDMIHFEMPSAADELVAWVYNLLLEQGNPM